MQADVRPPTAAELASVAMRRIAATFALLSACAFVAGTVVVVPASGQSEDELQQRISGSRADDARLRKALSRLAAVERRLGREAAVVQRRLDAVEASYAQARAELATTRTQLSGQRDRALRMRTRLADGRETLADQLRRGYMSEPPDLVGMVVSANGVADLLDRLAFERRVQTANANVLRAVRSARRDARGQARRLAALGRRRERAAVAIGRQRAAIAQIRAAFAVREDELRTARAARQAALRRNATGRRSAERALRRLERARAQRYDSRGPGGPWAIPWLLVQCESGGPNLPPNSAGASGYYQFMPQTWRNLGGSTPNAYQASKAEQDRLAAKLWNGGAGRSNWVCAGLV